MTDLQNAAAARRLEIEAAMKAAREEHARAVAALEATSAAKRAEVHRTARLAVGRIAESFGERRRATSEACAAAKADADRALLAARRHAESEHAKAVSAAEQARDEARTALAAEQTGVVDSVERERDGTLDQIAADHARERASRQAAHAVELAALGHELAALPTEPVPDVAIAEAAG